MRKERQKTRKLKNVTILVGWLPFGRRTWTSVRMTDVTAERQRRAEQT